MYERVFYKKPLANIILNGKNFTPKIESKAKISFLIRLFSIALEILASTVTQEKRNRLEMNNSYCLYLKITSLCREKKSQRIYKKKKLLELMCEFI